VAQKGEHITYIQYYCYFHRSKRWEGHVSCIVPT